MMERACAQCGAPLRGRSNRRYCTIKCQREHNKEVWRAANPKSPAASLTASAVAERNVLAVVADLLARLPNTQLYRALFPAQECDLVALDWGFPFSMWRIEVVTGHRTTSGNLQHAKRDPSKYDVLAIVVGGSEVVYEPPIGEWAINALTACLE